MTSRKKQLRLLDDAIAVLRGVCTLFAISVAPLHLSSRASLLQSEVLAVSKLVATSRTHLVCARSAA
eukprot:1707726-Alexandrium_andersonii.AAC.1